MAFPAAKLCRHLLSQSSGCGIITRIRQGFTNRDWAFHTSNNQCRALSLASAELSRILPSMEDLGLQENDQVTVAMSGGVDSSVALRLLSDFPVDIQVVFMRNWDPLLSESGPSTTPQYSYKYNNPSSIYQPNMSPCEWKQDWEDVQNVAKHVGIPEKRVKMVDLSSEYWGKVFEPSLRVWEEGGTPNPDVGCNREIKFGALLDFIPDKPRSFLATGHYARIQHRTESSHLYRAVDMSKDQTYYLSSLTQPQLRRAIFPLAHIPKTSTRALAAHFNLPTAVRRESMGLCFVGKRAKFGDFISQYIAKPITGYLVSETGERLGEHQGMWYYTEGQKAKIGGMKEGLFVAKKRVGEDGRDILVVPRQDHPRLLCTRMRTEGFSWIHSAPPVDERYLIQARHREGPISAILDSIDAAGNCTFNLLESIHGVGIGQVLGVWKENECLGSGVITRTWDSVEFPLRGGVITDEEENDGNIRMEG